MGGDPFELSQEETVVMLGRYAGASIPDLARSTGMAAPQVEAIVERLSQLGLLGDETPEPPADPAPREPEAAPHADDDLVALLDAAIFDLTPQHEPPLALPPHTEPPRPSSRMTPSMRRRLDGEPTPEPLAPAEEEPLSAEPDADAPPEAPPGEETREYRKLFETELHPLPLDRRVALAGEATGARLFALCFDPAPQVIAAMFENTATGLDHARLIAFHQRDPRALDHLMRRPPLLHDAQVHRRLVRNPATTEPMARKLLGGKRLVEVHKASLDRDVPERTRVTARALLRTKFTTAPSEEKVDLVWSTEGRVLVSLVGVTFDSRMTSLLCSRTYASIMLVQNLGRFPATPPALLAYLLRQPLVKRQQQLRNLLLQHPNTPSEAKRRG